MNIVHTDGENKDFIYLCHQLDNNLDELVGGAIQRKHYNQYNQLDDIRDAVVLYMDDKPVAGGSFRRLGDSTAEIKRVYVEKEYRRRGLSKVVMNELENMAMETGHNRLILETGNMLEASINLYQSVGFKIIENYGQYKNMPKSVCMEKVLQN